MSGSFESVRWNACVHRLDLSYSQSTERVFGEPMLTPKEKSPLRPGGGWGGGGGEESSEDGTHDPACVSGSRGGYLGHTATTAAVVIRSRWLQGSSTHTNRRCP